MTIPMARIASQCLSARSAHPGLTLDKGLREWDSDATKRGNRFGALVAGVASIDAPEIYASFYNRWLDMICRCENFAVWAGQLDGRLYIGNSGANPIEVSISMHKTYGVPLIAGSAIKGVTRAFALRNDVSGEVCDVIFGKEPKRGDASEDTSSAGHLIFHDAWWIPNDRSKPYAQEVITVHHPNYYKEKGKVDATDLDSPNPNVQVAARGSFLFLIEGQKTWANWAMTLLVEALKTEGIGAKTFSGYGYFVDHERINADIDKRREAIALERLPVKQRIKKEVEKLGIDGIEKLLGKGWDSSKEKSEYELNGQLEIFIDIVKEKYGEDIVKWKDLTGKPSKHRRRVYRMLYGDVGSDQ